MKRDLSRLFNPKSIALFGGNWVENVTAQLQKSGFAGDIWPVNPKRDNIGGFPCYKTIDDLPGAPDASFVGVNRELSIEVIAHLAKMGAGGATCFASGFLESEGEAAGGAELQSRLVEAAGDMPILGPNCYGLLNYLDNVTLWPDQHGGLPVETGVGIIAQSSNIAINMTMQARALPIAMMIAAGNQAQTGISEIATHMLNDDRITAIGLYLEGFGDIRALENFANAARQKGKPVVVLKIGRSQKARLATATHTASLAGDAAAASALISRLGFVETHSIGVFLETAKLLHHFNRLDGNAVCSVSCSGGEASLMSDLTASTQIELRDFSSSASVKLKRELGPLVTIANPLDYHTFIWGDTPHMTRVFEAVLEDQFDLTVFVLDIPRDDRCDPSSFQCAVDAIIAAKKSIGGNLAVLASLPENINERFSAIFAEAGVVPLHGMEEGLAAIDALISASFQEEKPPVLLECSDSHNTITLNENEAKAELAKFGLAVPQSVTVNAVEEIADAVSSLKFPLCLKALGLAHKSEQNAVVINLQDLAAVEVEARRLAPIADGFLIEEMITGSVAELIVGITRDPTGLFLLTLGAGGVMTELLEDVTHTLLPTSEEVIRSMLKELKINALLSGFRGKPAADLDGVIASIVAICRYGEENAEKLLELDVNPLIATQNGAVAVDALIRIEEEGNEK